MVEYKAVDLGLHSGLKWSDRNVGAANVQDCGDYFMWGSTEPDTDKSCDWAHAPFNDRQKGYGEEYFNAHRSEWLDGNALKPEYDAAHAAMGGSWRMPTSVEMWELIDGTTQSVETLSGVKGMRFTSKSNGNTIFMPFAGDRGYSDSDNMGDCGYAWSSSLCAGYADYSHGLSFDLDGDAYVSYNVRYASFVVRGVCV